MSREPRPFQPRASYYGSRRRHAMRRVDKALRSLALHPQEPMEAEGESIRLGVFLRPRAIVDDPTTPRPWDRIPRPGLRMVIHIPFDLSKPEVERLILVRATLAVGNKGTVCNG